jgi:hypothetical protein
LERLDGKGWHPFEDDGGNDGLRQNNPLSRHQRWEVSQAAIEEVLGKNWCSGKMEAETLSASDD